MTKSTKCAVLLVSLFVLSAGVNSIFILTAGGKKLTEQVHRLESTAQKTAVVDCALKPTHCPITTR